MDSEQDLALIDAYLSGSLSAEQQAAVSRRLASDAEFQELYEFTRSVQRVARQQERQRLKAMLQALDQAAAAPAPDTVTGPKVIPIASHSQPVAPGRAQPARTWRWPFTTVGIAAAVVAALLVWQPTRSSNEEVFATYAGSTVSTAVLPEPAGEERTAGTRGTEAVLPGFTAAESEQFAQAVDYLQAKEYEQAKTLLKQLVQARGERPELLWNLAVAQLNSHEVAGAVHNLESLRHLPALAARQEVAYDLALGYIQQGRLSQARELLQEVAQSDSRLAPSAAAILGKLRWWF